MTEPITIGYWSIKGLGAPLRMMVMYSNVPLKCENYDFHEKEGGGYDNTEWFAGAKIGFKEQNCLINLPYVKDSDFLVTQTNACFTYLGRKLKMLGKDENELIACEQLLCEIMDLRNRIVGFVYGNPQHQNAEKFFKGILSTGGSVDKLNLWLERKYINQQPTETCTFFVGDSATAPDFHIWEIVDQIQAMINFFQITPEPLVQYPHLFAFHKNFAALPANTRYLESRLAKLPCNAVFATMFGGTPDGKVITAGQEIDWKHSSDLY